MWAVLVTKRLKQIPGQRVSEERHYSGFFEVVDPVSTVSKQSLIGGMGYVNLPHLPSKNGAECVIS